MDPVGLGFRVFNYSGDWISISLMGLKLCLRASPRHRWLDVTLVDRIYNFPSSADTEAADTERVTSFLDRRERVRCIKEIQGLALGVAGQYHSLAGQVECKAGWCNPMDSTIVAMHLSWPACCSSNEGQICRKHS